MNRGLKFCIHHSDFCTCYSPQSSCSMGASCTAAGSSEVTSRSTPQSEQTRISPTSVPAASSTWASHSGQFTVDMIWSPLIFHFILWYTTNHRYELDWDFHIRL